MTIYNVTDERFKKYGTIMQGYDFTALAKAMESTPCPDDVVYEPGIDALEALDVAEEISRVYYGEMPIQVGYCNGHNKKLNAVEYHRDSELDIAMTDAVLLLGMEQDIEADGTYDTSKIEAFFVPAMTGVELYATTLHYAPCNPGTDGFKVVIVLPKGTNYPLKGDHSKGGEDATLAATNKWLIGHAEGGLPEGRFIGLKGANVTID